MSQFGKGIHMHFKHYLLIVRHIGQKTKKNEHTNKRKFNRII